MFGLTIGSSDSRCENVQRVTKRAGLRAAFICAFVGPLAAPDAAARAPHASNTPATSATGTTRRRERMAILTVIPDTRTVVARSGRTHGLAATALSVTRNSFDKRRFVPIS